jgi:hypothetical protein
MGMDSFYNKINKLRVKIQNIGHKIDLKNDLKNLPILKELNFELRKN